MRIDPDTCDDPVLLTDEVRRLRSDVSRRRDLEAGLMAGLARLRLTDAEREAVEAAIDSFAGGADFNDQRGWPATAQRLRERAANLRELLVRMSGNGEK